MNHSEKQLKYSIRKVSVGASSVVIGALYLLMGAGIAHAEGVESVRETERTAKPTDPEQSGNGETGNKPDLSNTDAAANTYNAPVAENPLVTPESTKPRTRSKRELADEEASDSSNGATDPADTDPALLDANRKGDAVKEHQPGVIVPKDGEKGGDDKNANLKFDDSKENLTLEQLWDIVKNMPDDFQNNERSYLRNMNTLGDALRFKDGKVVKDEDGEKLQDGEIREINEFGGWVAISGGTFAIGKKNAQGYFTGWYTDKDGHRQEGGMLGSDALDRVYLHEQALDRRFNYMLMLAKGRTIANKDDKAQDNSPFDIKTENRTGNKEHLNSLPVKDKEDILQHSPNIEGFNGIEKTFTAFSTKYGSRLKIDFVTGYISDYEGSKGTYRIVVKAIKKGETDNTTKEETIYDHTINRIDGVVENEERYSQGVDLSNINRTIKRLLKDEYNKKVNILAHAKYKKKYPSERGVDVKKLKPLKEEAKQELAKKGDVIVELPIDKDKLREGTGKLRNKFKEELNFTERYATVANKLQNVLRHITDSEVQKKSAIWVVSTEKNPDGTLKSKDRDRVYKLLDFVLPTAKKIIYHADTDQLELQTDPEKVKNHRQELEARLKTKEASLASTTNEEDKTKLNKEISALKAALGSTNAYTYLEARNGSKEAKILGSLMEATVKPPINEMTDADYNKYRTNELAAKEKDGLSKFTAYFVEKENIERSEVISDDELSKKIHAEIGGDNDKLGKGGYFSTGDIPLGKDVVAYKIQVFADNEKRVGVNKQSPRLQYNLPILADFSVIQDTVEPSRTVVEKIIPKLNIPPEEKDKITEEIKKKKKTSELAELISGNVKVRYVDEQGNLLSLKNDTGIGEKESDGTYITNKKQLIGTSYDVTDKKLSSMTTTDGKYYTFEKEDIASASLTGDIVREGRTVTLVYRESEAPTTATVTANYYKEGTQEKLAESVVKADLAIGSQYTTEAKTIEGKTTTEDKEDRVITRKTTYTLVATPANATGTVPEDGATVNYYYRENVEETVVPKTATSTETKTITRTIHYVDKVTNQNVKEDVVQPVTLSRTKIENKVTGVVTYGEWTTGNWDEKASPSVENYGPAETATVSSATVTSASTDETVVVKYPQATEDVTETKTVTRTIKYVDATDETTEVASPVTQTVELTRTNKRNKVTGEETAGDWSTGTWGSQDSPTVTNYDAPDKATVAETAVTSTTTDTTEVVKYPQATEDVTESKTVTRTIKYVDATDETTEVASPVTQTVELTRTNKN